jgi:inorganic pyrophosphatase
MYKEPEGKHVEIHGWADRDDAEEAVDEGRRRYAEAQP